MFEWYDLPGALVYVTWWFGVGVLLMALLALLSLALKANRLQDRLCAGIAMCFLVAEVAVLSNLYLQVNTPNWFEYLFVFNGFALPIQLIFVIGALVTSEKIRSYWLLAGVIPSLASIPFFAAAAMIAFGASDA